LTAAKGSVGGALVAAQGLQQAGLPAAGLALANDAVNAFLHSFSWSLRVGGLVAFGGAILAATLLPSRPGREGAAVPDTTGVKSMHGDGTRDSGSKSPTSVRS
jgi:hypothetical protein